MDKKVSDALAQVPILKNLDPDKIDVERLGGLSNKVYKVAVAGECYILRIPGDHDQDGVDRIREIKNANIAAKIDVSAKVIFYSHEDGLMLTQFIDQALTMTPDMFKSVIGAPTRAARVFKRLHECGEKFGPRYDVFDFINAYKQAMVERGIGFPDGFQDIMHEAKIYQQALVDNPVSAVPSHCDPVCENLLDDGDRMWIVDWEHSSMADPMWDLGYLSAQAGFNKDQDQEMMKGYFGTKISARLFARMVIYKAMSNLLCALWGFTQHTDNKPAQDFQGYASARFERCQRQMSRTDFSEHVSVLLGYA